MHKLEIAYTWSRMLTAHVHFTRTSYRATRTTSSVPEWTSLWTVTTNRGIVVSQFNEAVLKAMISESDEVSLVYGGSVFMSVSEEVLVLYGGCVFMSVSEEVSLLYGGSVFMSVTR